MAIQIAEGIILAVIGLFALMVLISLLARVIAWRPTNAGHGTVPRPRQRNAGERLLGKIILALGAICLLIWITLFTFGNRFLGK